MTTHGIHHVYVLDDDDRPAAVVTPTALALHQHLVEDEDSGAGAWSPTASEAMMLRGRRRKGGREEIARRTRRVRDRTRDEAPTASSRERLDEAERREGTKKRR